MDDKFLYIRINAEILSSFKTTINNTHPSHIDGRGYGMSCTLKRLILAYIANPNIIN